MPIAILPALVEGGSDVENMQVWEDVICARGEAGGSVTEQAGQGWRRQRIGWRADWIIFSPSCTR